MRWIFLSLPDESRQSIDNHPQHSWYHARLFLGLDLRPFSPPGRGVLFNGPRGLRSVGLFKKKAAAALVALTAAVVAGYCGADEVLAAPHVYYGQPDPFPQEPLRFFPYRSAKGIQTIETGADDALVVAQASAPPSPGVPPPDFHIPQGPGRLGVLEPPKRFLHWTDHVEIVLSPADVAWRCQTAGAKAAPGARIHDCSYTVAGRCLIIRVDDPGVARHELAHCNGWTHPERGSNTPRP